MLKMRPEKKRRNDKLKRWHQVLGNVGRPPFSVRLGGLGDPSQSAGVCLLPAGSSHQSSPVVPPSAQWAVLRTVSLEELSVSVRSVSAASQRILA